MSIFKDRQQAGVLVAKRLKQFSNKPNTLILAIPRGGVVVAAEIAKKLNLPLDIVVTRKIGAPAQPELALGAIDPVGKVYWDEKLINDLGLKINDLSKEVNKEKKEVLRRERLYRQGRPPLELKGKVTILVDDGIATGATILSAINYLKSQEVKKIVVASPVAAADVISKITDQVDQLTVLEEPEYLGAVGSFYQNFEAVSDEEVIKILTVLEK